MEMSSKKIEIELSKRKFYQLVGMLEPILGIESATSPLRKPEVEQITFSKGKINKIKKEVKT